MIIKIKRIGIDARFYGPLGKGLGRYTQEVVDHIIKLDPDNEYVIFLRRENFNDLQADGVRVKKILADIRWYSLAEQLIFPFYIWREKLDLMHFPHFNVPLFCPVKFVVTIHDLILIKFPTLRATTLGPAVYKLKNLAYKMVIRLAVKRARKVLTVSEYTKNDIVRQFRVEPQKIIVTYEGVTELSNSSFPPRPAFAGRESPPALQARRCGRGGNYQYLLYVGNVYPHKNLESLIKVFSEINKNLPDLKLILVGKEDYFYSRLKQLAKNFSHNIIFPGYLPDNELAELYSQAALYVFPSFYEGFGLPPLEAMAHGLAVVSSNKTCLPEILGQAALYFNPDDQADMKHKIEQALADEKLRVELINRGYRQAKKYNWQTCAEKTLAVYKNSLK
ncbi:MAG: glycosyltransferase family 4 protein [Parcubacteria group bacterium]|nr:glycosyltransferase family 4 protein [Parcubacteria group bacterium]